MLLFPQANTAGLNLTSVQLPLYKPPEVTIGSSTINFLNEAVKDGGLNMVEGEEGGGGGLGFGGSGVVKLLCMHLSTGFFWCYSLYQTLQLFKFTKP